MKIEQSKQLRIFIALILSTSLLAQAGDFQMISIKDSSLPASDSGGGFSGVPILTPDGRFVVFASAAENLVVTTNNGPSSLSFNWLNVFIRDRASGTTRLASPNLAGTGGGNNNSFPSGISTNGQYVLFESAASDLITGDTNESNDVFVRDVVNGTTTLVSIGLNGAYANGASRSSTISADGRFVAFVSAATNLVTGDSNGIADVFVRDLAGNTTTLASVGAKPKGAASPIYFSESPKITPDGRYVAFYSTATNLVPNSTASGEVYVRDQVAGTTYWTSTNARAIYFSVAHSSNAVSCNQVISGDGRYVAFETCTNAGNSSVSVGVIMRRDLQTGVTDIIHTNAYVSSPMYETIDDLDMTPDGRFIVFVANTNASATCIYRWDAQTAALDLISGSVSNTVSAGTFSDWPTVDASGQYVAFASTALNLTTNTLSGTTNDYHLYVRNTVSGITSLAGKNLGGSGAVVSPVSPASQLSEDGQLVAFESMAGVR
jgi:hypothetical protein